MFCEKCGLKMVSNKCSCGHEQYDNPKPLIIGLIPVLYNNKKYLLGIKRGLAPHQGQIALPGGYQHMEHIKCGLARKIQQETNIDLVKYLKREDDFHHVENSLKKSEIDLNASMEAEAMVSEGGPPVKVALARAESAHKCEGSNAEIEQCLLLHRHEDQEKLKLLEQHIELLGVESTPDHKMDLIFFECNVNLSHLAIDWGFNNKDTERICLIDEHTPIAFSLHKKMIDRFFAKHHCK